MADFVAVLKKTIDGLAEPTPAMRERVYDKARATVTAKLSAINPPPSAAVVERQRKSLEDAIRQVEAEYSAPPPATTRAHDPIDELEDVFASLNASRAMETSAARPPAGSHEARPASHAPHQPQPARPPVASHAPRPQPAPPIADLADDDPLATPLPASGTYEDDYVDEDEPERRRRGLGGLIAAVLLLAAIGGGAYAAWLNRDELSAMLGFDLSGKLAEIMPESSPPPAKNQEPAAGTAGAVNEAPKEAKPEPVAPATDEPAEAAAETPPPAQPAGPEKLTQRLNADGSESEEGPAGGVGTLGEGTSIAAVTQPPAMPPAAASPEAVPPPVSAPETTGSAGGAAVPPADATAATAPAPAAAPGEAQAPGTVPVSQKAIFYEERTNLAQGSADMGSIVWSVVQELPGGDQPPEPAIRAEATIPGKDLQLRMTIRRNGDPTLPASHIIEMIFLTPEGFEGGGIENILRVSLKDSEQSAGNPLIGIPAKIADGFFLVALNDSKAEIDANLALLNRDQWIDVPLVYKSGRRALITMEKGVPGEKVFEETIKAWQAKAAGSAG